MKAGWEVRPLGEFTETVTKGTTPTSVGHKFTDTGVNFVKIEAIDLDGKIKPEKLAKISPEAHAALRRSQLQEGDVLFSIAGALGRITIVEKSILPANTNQALSIIRLRKGAQIDKTYLAYCLSSSAMNEQIAQQKGGVAQQNLSLAQVKCFEIPIPPLKEQKRIVAVLDAAFKGLTRAAEHARANLQNARELFEGFASGVVTDCLAQYPTAYLPQISENLDRQRVPITKANRTKGNVPYYGASGVVDHVSDYLFDEELLLVSEDGANLLARTYPIAFSVSGKTWVNNHAHVLRFKERSQREFVSLYLNAISLEPYVSGMAQPKVNQKALNTIPIPNVPDDACQVIISRASDLRSSVDKLQKNYRTKLTDIADLRQSLLQKAFAGELT